MDKPTLHSWMYMSMDHLQADDVKDLPVMSARNYASLFVCVPENDEIMRDTIKDLPRSLIAPLMYAYSLGVTLIVFDRDEPPMDCLPTY